MKIDNSRKSYPNNVNSNNKSMMETIKTKGQILTIWCDIKVIQTHMISFINGTIPEKYICTKIIIMKHYFTTVIELTIKGFK